MQILLIECLVCIDMMPASSREELDISSLMGMGFGKKDREIQLTLI